MYDPHANAQALMGGTSMNAQPQSLIASQTPQVSNPTDQSSFTPQPPTAQQTQQMTYQGTPQAGVNYPNFDPSAINPYLDGDQKTYASNGYVDNSYTNRVNSAPVNSLLMGNAQTPQGVVGVDPDEKQVVIEDPTDYSKEAQVEVGQPQVSVGGPFDWVKSLLSPDIDREELIRRGIIPPK